MRRMSLAALGLALVLSGGSAPSQPAAEPEVRIVKYDGLAAEVLKHRGKVVLVDFWFTT